MPTPTAPTRPASDAPQAQALSPELMREVRRLQARTKRRVEGLFAGEYHAAFKGRGIEFAEVREYEPGDDIRAIDWNVTARVGRPFVKRFIEEREQTVILAVDISRSGELGSVGKGKARLAAEVGAVLTLAAITNNDRAGLMLFSDGVDQFIPHRKGRTHAMRLMRELLSARTRGQGTDIAAALTHLSRVVRKRAIIFLVSDFMAPGFENPLSALSARHEVIALSITDPREQTLPDAGLVTLADAETGRELVIDASSRGARARFADAARARMVALESVFRRTAVDHVALSTARPFVAELERYFRAKEHRR